MAISCFTLLFLEPKKCSIVNAINKRLFANRHETRANCIVSMTPPGRFAVDGADNSMIQRMIPVGMPSIPISKF